jgi:hypothetical protein
MKLIDYSTAEACVLSVETILMESGFAALAAMIGFMKQV